MAPLMKLQLSRNYVTLCVRLDTGRQAASATVGRPSLRRTLMCCWLTHYNLVVLRLGPSMSLWTGLLSFDRSWLMGFCSCLEVWEEWFPTLGIYRCSHWWWVFLATCRSTWCLGSFTLDCNCPCRPSSACDPLLWCNLYWPWNFWPTKDALHCWT